jgi:hypothetical protein
MGLASSLLLYKEMKRQRKGNEGIRQEEEKEIAPSACTEPSSCCLHVAILSLSLALTRRAAAAVKRKPGERNIYIYIHD